MKKIAFLCPYFGKFPEHFQLWLNSCKKNSNHMWFVFTDDKRKFDYPENVKVFYTSLEKLRDDFQKKFDFPISLSGVYKLGDYKPLFGYLFEDLIEGYDAWGHIDVADEIYGNINKFVTDELLDNYDKLMLFGHMTIYKNSYEVNRYFMKNSDADFTYKDVFSSEKFYNFEEVAEGSIYKIYIENGLPIGRLDEYIADLSGLNYRFRISTWNYDCTANSLSSERMIFTWENGSVYGYSIKNDVVEKTEYLYVHFKRRKMALKIGVEADKYCIVPDGFLPFENTITTQFIKNNSKSKIFYKVYLQEKKKGLKRRINSLLKRRS